MRNHPYRTYFGMHCKKSHLNRLHSQLGRGDIALVDLNLDISLQGNSTHMSYRPYNKKDGMCHMKFHLSRWRTLNDMKGTD